MWLCFFSVKLCWSCLFAPGSGFLSQYTAQSTFSLSKNKQTFAQSKPIHFFMLIRALQLEKIMGQKEINRQQVNYDIKVIDLD